MKKRAQGLIEYALLAAAIAVAAGAAASVFGGALANAATDFSTAVAGA